MNKIEKIKVAVDVALYYFTITTVFYILSITLPYFLFSDSNDISIGLRFEAMRYVPLIIAIIFLAILSNLLKRKVHGPIGIDCKPLIFIIVGVLFIITGILRISSYVSVIGVFLELISPNQDSSLMYAIYRAIVPIVIYVVQIGIGAYLTFIFIKRDKQLENIKVAVNVALGYFTITTVLNLFSKSLSDLLFRTNMDLTSKLKLSILYYAVSVVVILFLAILSQMLKKKVQGPISIGTKQLLFIIVGVLLIITGLTEIPTEISMIHSYKIYLIDKGISQIEKTQFINNMYLSITYLTSFTLEIGIGAYITFMAMKMCKHIEEIH